ncbi:MAG: hypothetical protein N2652_07245 [Kiritimatiellae bacterium]|nr:hypothetical protein [Kiritimatiellia bacterium]
MLLALLTLVVAAAVYLAIQRPTAAPLPSPSPLQIAEDPFGLDPRHD